MAEKHIAPAYQLNAFHCPHCRVYADQTWNLIWRASRPPVPAVPYPSSPTQVANLEISVCRHCQEYALWRDGAMIYPRTSGAPLPAADMPADVRRDYAEAWKIAGDSPRGAAALLRLALQKLMLHLGEKGENLNEDIANLVKKGLNEKIRMALDAVRVVGNHAVHPGEMDLRDDSATASRLFELVNLVVEAMVTQPKRVAEVYDKIPETAKKAIEKRDR